MRIGVPKEILDNENRVALTPDGARALVAAGHAVAVERQAGVGSGFADDDYRAAGASIVSTAEAWDAGLVVKVKEPQRSEHGLLGKQILFTYLHLAGVDHGLTDALLAAGTTAIAYETVRDSAGRLPLLAPMSAIAGSMAPIMGVWHLAKYAGGRGTLVASILENRFGKITVIGDGVVGRHAAKTAAGIGGRVTIFGIDPARRAELEALAPGIEFALSTPEAIAAAVRDSDLVIGAVLIQGARAPRVVTEAMVKGMPAGSVIVDVSIDQGGCVETSRPTTHSNPVFVAHGVVHYCVTNMPGAYPRTATLALTNATLPYVLRLAGGGLAAALADPGFAAGVNVHTGVIRNRAVAEALGRKFEALV
jgi:alanine dehydrogenase